MENNNYSTFNPNNQSQNINDNQNNQSSNLINNQNIQSSNLNNAQIINNQSNENLLINNNLILREDINRLSDLNKNLENELKTQRFKNYQIANQNDTLNKSNLVLSSQINKINCLISKAKMKENNLQNDINKRSNIEEILKQTEIQCQNVNNEKNQIEIDYKVLCDKFNKLKEKSKNDQNCLIYIKCQQEEKMNKIDEKINKMLFEIESLKKENCEIRNSIDYTRKNIEQVNFIKLNLNEKINEEKCKNDLLNKDLENYKNEYEKLKIDLNEEMLKKEKEDKIRKEKVQNKLKMVSDLQKKIEDFKKSRIKSK
jgi:hypothetical protein